MTIVQALKFAKNRLDNLYTSDLDSEVLLQHALNCDKNFIFTHPDHKLSFWQFHRFKKLITKHAKHIPVAYLTGHKEFYGLCFKVNQHTLIPRPETELMVEEVLNYINDSEFEIKNLQLIDIGTGTGCIPISILKNSSLKNCIASDISSRALKVANLNAKHHKVKIKFFQSDLLKNIPVPDSHLIITANLPYLHENQTGPSIKHEPVKALYAGKDGLKYYRQLLEQLSELKYNFTAFFEVDPSQTGSIKKLINQYLSSYKIQIKKDLANNDRLVIIRQ